MKQAETIEGPTMLLTDQENLCAFARFCDPKGKIWNLVKLDNPEAREIVKHEAAHCPAGRLVIWDKKTGKAIEPEFEPSLGLIEDTEKKVSLGPIWVRGSIPVVSAEREDLRRFGTGSTLCRCGKVQPTNRSATARMRPEPTFTNPELICSVIEYPWSSS